MPCANAQAQTLRSRSHCRTLFIRGAARRGFVRGFFVQHSSSPRSLSASTQENRTARYLKLECVKSYATEENAKKAVEKLYANSDLRYFIARTDDGRFFPVFLGQEAVTAGVHFNFNVVG